MDVLSPGRGAVATPGSQAAALAGSSRSSRSSRACRRGFFHAPQAAPAWFCSAPLLPPERRCSQPGARRGKSEIEAAWRREREAEKARKNERARPNLAPPMGSVAAQRQVTISKLGPCSPGLVGGERAEGLPGSSANVLRVSGGGCHFPPILPGQATLRSPSNTPLLRNLSFECSPQTLECWERGGAEPRGLGAPKQGF